MDIRTLFLGDLVLEVCCGLGLLLMSRNVPGFRGLRWFAWAYGSATGGAFLLFLNGSLHAVWIALAGRWLMLLGAVLLTQGVAEFVVPASSALGWGASFLVLFAAVDFIYSRSPVQGQSDASIVIFGVAFAAQLLVGILVLASHDEPGVGTACHATAGLLTGLAVLSLARAALVPLRGVGWLANEAVTFGGVVLYMLFSAGMAFGVVWMMTARLRNLLEAQAGTDALTSVLNRRALESAVQREIAACRRRASPLTVLAIDLDHFKALNDTHGHAAGDAMLAATARLLQQGLRNTDLVARYGGEEFIVVLPERDSERAGEIAERLRARMEALRVEFEGHALSVTASFGIASLAGGDAWAELLRRADQALYEAKRAGRNCLRGEGVAAPETPPVSRHKTTIRVGA